MKILRRGFVASAAATTILIAGSIPLEHHTPINQCNPNLGYLISTQNMRTENIAGTYDIKQIHALSMFEDGSIMKDRGKEGIASMQLNAYLKGMMRDHKQTIYWVQDTLHFVSYKGKKEQYLESEVFRFTPDRHTAYLQEVKGKGLLRNASGTAPGMMTYIYGTHYVPAHFPQKGYLEMDESLKNGKIEVKIRYQNSISDKLETYDTITIGKNQEFKNAYFFSNNIFDAEFGFGGDASGATGYFSNTDVYLALYYGRAGKYAIMTRSYGKDPETTEHAANLSCLYSSNNYMQFYAFNE